MIRLTLILIFLNMKMPLACARETVCDPDHINLTEATQQSRTLSPCDNCEAFMPKLACGWMWLREYKLDVNDPYEWQWRSWPDGVHLVISQK